MQPEPTDNPFQGLEINHQNLPQQALVQQQQTTEPKTQGKLSKAQEKKLRRKQKWEEAKKIKKIRKKQFKKQNANNQPKRQPKATEKKEYITQRKRKEDYLEKLQKGMKVIIDLQFFDEMTEKERNSLFKQLTHCHSTNRRMEKACCLILSSVNGRKYFIQLKYNANHWGIHMEPRNLIDCFPREQLVYLTGDAQQELNELQTDKVYIIGGLVDHNRLKKITYNYALQNKIRVARFPLDKYVDLKSNCHLAVNHIYEILLKVYNGDSWEKAVKESIPSRKINEDEKEPLEQPHKLISQ